MGRLISMGPCSFCGGGHKTACFATYDDGYHCFSCGKRKSINKSLYAFRQEDPIINNGIVVPKHTYNIKEFSPQVLSWLYKYYVFEDLIRKYRISYVPYAKFGGFEGESLLLPYFKGNELISYQRRFFPNKKFITGGNKQTTWVMTCNHKSNMLILVEDYISAIRLGEHYNTICLQGIKLRYEDCSYISKTYSQIKIWLDPDKEGQAAANIMYNQIVKALNKDVLFNAFSVREPKNVEVITTEKQPKDYSNQELITLIRGNNEFI